MQTIREHIIGRIWQSFVTSQRRELRLFQKNLQFYKIYDMIR